MGTKNLFDSKNQPKKRRGKDKRTLILKAIAEGSMIGLAPDCTPDDAEQALFSHIAKCAFDQDDNARSVCLSALLDRGWAKLKPEGSSVKFDLKSDTLYGQSVEVLKAVSDGDLTVDQGTALVGAISSVMKIKEIEEFDERLKALEGSNEQA